MSKERPILFSSPMVRAILAGKKTETRRIVKPSNTESSFLSKHLDVDWERGRAIANVNDAGVNEFGYLKFPFNHKDDSWDTDADYQTIGRFFSRIHPGDLLWVKETHFVEITGDFPYAGEGLRLSQWTPELIKETIVHYRATTQLNNPDDWRWRPSIFMPRWASRINLWVMSVHAERLWDITEEGAVAEGIDPDDVAVWNVFNDPDEPVWTNRSAYADLWEQINGKGSWAKNPWVWVIKFEKEESA
jgi:hypothetical protein